ncbi:MAG TPA: hypothetical protein EYM33_11660 [Pseudomonadales bacterium]|jgi:predicted small lipoprotein YifL|nr:lipoprotein [Pseudomonadales bacterium]MED5555371.1 lipoprotein [Pseudomonadota bacterium]HIC35447.1 hypothetical protein [Gammaproteobacteria bacterium]HIM36180.1 hypothetical protein [Pseudomonadales bacterium]
MRLFLIAAVCFLVATCGQKGPLTLPDETVITG